MIRQLSKSGLVLALVALMCGCGSVRMSMPIAVRTPAYCGEMKLYGTDNVPFEYEELGVVAVFENDWTSVEDKMDKFISEAQKMGADAIVNFSIEPANDIVLVFFGFGGGAGPCSCSYLIKGVAVKVKRP